MMEKHCVGSETGRLRDVMLHRPSLDLRRLTPSNCQELLFNDVLPVERASEEHDIFTNTPRQQGIEVLLLIDLLTQTLDIPGVKSWLLEAQISDYRLGPTFAADVHAWFAEMSYRDFARHLSDGLAYSEILASIKNMVVDTHGISDFIMKPLPNHLLARDTSRQVYSGVSVNPTARPTRQCETSNLRTIYRWHPQFADDKFTKYFGDESISYDHVTLEGGDVLVIGRRAVLIDMFKRTTPQGTGFLAQALFKHRQAERITVVELSKHRSCIHLGTIMACIGINTFSVCPGVARPDVNCWMLVPDGYGGLKRTQESTFPHAIEKALGIDQVRLITTGSDASGAEREQRDDANNVLTLRSGVVVDYERNIWTNEKYNEVDIIALLIPNDKLDRGRGDARCMSYPLHRDGT